MSLAVSAPMSDSIFSKEMFRSCAPCSALVDGVKSGSGSFWDSTRPLGKGCPQISPEPLFTPSTKAEQGAHDLNISFEKMESLIGADTAKLIREVSLTLYARAASYAESKGIIIADTKLEFGIDPSSGQPILIDEMLTPDASGSCQ